MQAIILAAGMGKRLKELTSEATKCMVKVNGVAMIDRMMGHLDKLGLSRIVVVVGYEGQKLMEYIDALGVSTPIVYVDNNVYNKTNNIYSLYLAKDYLVQEDTILLESDLVFEEAVLHRLINHPYPSLVLVDKFESWMDGTVVTLDEQDNIQSFVAKREFDFRRIDEYYKTVNIYKFSKEFSELYYVPFLEIYCKALGTNEYYEQVLKVITFLEDPHIKAVKLEGEKWYEIDDVQDLDIAETIFLEGEEKLARFQKRYGGYWRYPKMLDFCYLVNPYFPNQKLIAEMQANFQTLLTQYPSGMQVNSLVAAKNFGLKEAQVIVGNGAAELIKSLMETITGKVGVLHPSFEEYANRKNREDLVACVPSNLNFTYSADELMSFFDNKDIQTLLIVNPDNPSGNYIKKADVLRICAWAKDKQIRLIIDESFVDFVDVEEDKSLLEQQLLNENPHLFVVKSISKSYGVPGLRLGIIASGDKETIAKMKKDVAIWNINSFAEFYMQIYEKYQSVYKTALQAFYESRKRFIQKLSDISFLRVIPSQANYVLCEVQAPMTSKALTVKLLEKNILIKDLADKNGFNGKQYVRIAVRDDKDNQTLIEALKTLEVQ
ncbi:MAG: aminotransferase class I/II-fold pyridoxal phosphate-dependent enzyme [Lachnospiraceae bacterium]|nr:aminotransferase class I/II-fold pyridoxal phosphate-dependent enzyme [Lachnospiraceae bacterium]